MILSRIKSNPILNSWHMVNISFKRETHYWELEKCKDKIGS